MMQTMRLALVVVAISLSSGRAAKAQLFEIAAPVFSSFVSENYAPAGSAVDGKISRASLTHGLIYFSFTVVGGEKTLEYLKANRMLEVVVVVLGNKSQFIQGLGISQQRWAANSEAWISQFKQLGYFTFRTYMFTQKIFDESVDLQIRDANRNVVKPVADSSMSYKATVTIIP